MNEFMFGVVIGKLDKQQRKIYKKAAKKFDVSLNLNVNLPGNDCKTWFSCRNYGNPHNDEMSKSVSDYINKQFVKQGISQ